MFMWVQRLRMKSGELRSLLIHVRNTLYTTEILADYIEYEKQLREFPKLLSVIQISLTCLIQVINDINLALGNCHIFS